MRKYLRIKLGFSKMYYPIIFKNPGGIVNTLYNFFYGPGVCSEHSGYGYGGRFCIKCGKSRAECVFCEESAKCKCIVCKMCNKKKPTGKFTTDYVNECCCNNPDYYKTLKQMKVIKREREYDQFTLCHSYIKLYNYFWVKPSGSTYYCEVHINQIRSRFSLTVTNEDGLFYLMNKYNDIDYTDFSKIHSINYEFGRKEIKVKLSSHFGCVIEFVKLKNVIKNGDIISLKITKDKYENHILINNKKVVTVYNNGVSLPFPPVFFVRPVYNELSVIIDTFYGLMTYKQEEKILDIDRKNYIDLKIKTRC